MLEFSAHQIIRINSVKSDLFDEIFLSYKNKYEHLNQKISHILKSVIRNVLHNIIALFLFFTFL